MEKPKYCDQCAGWGEYVALMPHGKWHGLIACSKCKGTGRAALKQGEG